jgi:hypothetical protein
MPNPRLIQTAERWMNKEVPVVKSRPQQQDQSIIQPAQNILYPDLPSDVFTLSYDGPHKDFAQELISKSNEMFAGTSAEIPAGTSGEVKNMYNARRMALVTAISKSSSLRNYGFLPITPMQDECLLREEKLQNPGSFWEDLALLLYDTEGQNPKEAGFLRENIKQHRNELGLSKSDLEKRLVVVNPGAETDKDMSCGVKPIIISGITQVYAHDILNKTGENHKFDYGLDRGLPSVSQIGNGKRTLYMPTENSNIGLRVLCRYRDLNLVAWDWDLSYASEAGRVSFAPQGLASKK